MDRSTVGIVVLMLIAIAGGVHWYQTDHRQAQVTAAHDDAVIAAARAKGMQTIHLYTATWCGYCKHLKEGLDSSGVPYVDHDVENSSEGRQFAQSSNFSGVPVTVIGDNSFDGYEAEGLHQFFAEAGYKVTGL